MKFENASKKYPFFKRDPKSGIYWVKAYWGKHPTQKSLEKSTGERSSKERALFEAIKIFERWKYGEERTSRRPKVSQVFTRYRELLEKKQRRPNTLRKIDMIYRNYIGPHFGGLYIDQITNERWLSYMLSEPSCLQETYVYLGAVLRLALKEGILKKPIDLDPPPSSEFEGRVLTSVEQAALLGCTQGKYRLLVQLGLWHGMRLGEALRLEASRVDLKEGVIRLYSAHTKTKKGRAFPVHPKTLKLLKNQINASESPFVFPGRHTLDRPLTQLGKMWPSLIQEAGIQGSVRFHDLRHTFLTTAAKQIKAKTSNFSIVEICTFAGLSVEVFMKHYLHLKPEDLSGIHKIFKGNLGDFKHGREKG